MHYATYGFTCFGIIQIVTVIVCLIKPSIVLTRDLRFDIVETRHKSAKAFFALRMVIFALFALVLIFLASEASDALIRLITTVFYVDGRERLPWLAAALVFEFLAVIGVNKYFTGRIFCTERNDLPSRKPLYIINACLVLVAVLLWSIPSVWTVDKAWNALVIEDGEVVGETTVTADFKVYDYLFRENEYSGTMRVDGSPELESYIANGLSRMYRYEFDYGGGKLVVYDGRISITTYDFENSDIIDGDLNFLIDEDARMVWIEEFAGYSAIDEATGEHVLDNSSSIYENPRSYVAYEGAYAEAAELYDLIDSYFDSESFVGLAEGYNPFR